MSGTADEPLEPRWRRLDPDARREQILAAAQREFAAKPYSLVSTAEIARAAGVARGLLNHYFGTKRDLYLEAVQQSLAVPPSAVMRLSDGSLTDRVDAAVTWYLDSLDASGTTWINIVGSQSVGRDPDLERILLAAENDWVERVLEAIGLADVTEQREELRAMIRAYGQLARTAGREWLVKKHLDRAQVHLLLAQCLLTIVDNVLPATLEGHTFT